MIDHRSESMCLINITICVSVKISITQRETKDFLFVVSHVHCDVDMHGMLARSLAGPS